MTDPLYLRAQGRQSFEATVERTDGDQVVLDRTLFYPTGGGQPHDTGTLEPVDGGDVASVVGVEGRGAIRHRLDGPVPSPGTTVEGWIDWDRRFAHMRYHTAQHLLSATLLERFDAPTTGNQLYADRARIDCAYDRFDEGDLATIEDRMNEAIDEDRPVETYTLDRASAEAALDPRRTRFDLLPESLEELRIVEIEGIDRTACGGTHVETTAACGTFTIAGRETMGANEERLRFTLSSP